MEFYVAKFGEQYLYDYNTIEGRMDNINLVPNVFEALRFHKKDIHQFKFFMDSGADIHEVNITEYNQSFSVSRELEEEE